MEMKRCVELDPNDVDTIIQIGKYEQSKDLHLVAIKTFTSAIAVAPASALAYLGRGVSMGQLLRDDEAVREMCQAIHLNPMASEAFFHRGSLLRTLAPSRALVDLSTSLLLDSSETNLHAFVHRGMLYLETKRYEEALTDFERALELDARVRTTQYEIPAPVSKVAVLAYCQIGYIHVHHTKNYMAAIKSYGEAVKEDPTYVQALLSRAECYYRVHRDCGGSESCLNMGVRDYGAAIRLYPDRPEYFILRGKLLLALGKTNLATDQVRAASGLQTGESSLGGQSFVQAQVQAFLGNHDLAAANLEGVVESLASASYMNNAYGGGEDDQKMRGAMMSTGYCHKDLPAAYALLGSILMSASRFEDAITQYEAALTLDNTNAEWFYDLGRCCSQVQDDPLAYEAFSCAIQLDNQHARAYYARGTCRLRMQDPRGIQDVNKALGIDSKMWQAYLSRACYYALSLRYTKAILNCNRAIEMEPRSVRSFMTRGCIKYCTGHVDGAIEDLEMAVYSDPNCSLAWYNLAVCYHWNSNSKLAKRAYSTVLLLEDEPNPVVYLNRGVLYFKEREFENALHDFMAVSDAPGMATEPRVIHSIALCRHRVGLLEESVNDYTRAIASGSAYTEALLGRGNAFTDYGHKEGRKAGRCDYQRAIRVDPTLMTGYINLAYSLQCEGQFQDAFNVLSSALRLNPKACGVLEARSIVNLQMSNFGGALKDISKAIGVKPSAELLTNRGVILIYTGDTLRAMEDFQKARELDPNFALAWYNAGNIYLQQRQLSQAKTFYDGALKAEANDECSLSNRALVNTLLGDHASALADLNAASVVSSAPMLFYNRAVVQMSLGDWKAAERDLTRYLDLADTNSDESPADVNEARTKRGWCKYRQGAGEATNALMDFVDSA
jgi:tetratricopeptide (TPR) repeat protein